MEEEIKKKDVLEFDAAETEENITAATFDVEGRSISSVFDAPKLMADVSSTIS